MGKNKSPTKVWLITDTHLNHTMLSDRGYRPVDFEDRIIRNLRAFVEPDDRLIHLGDVCIGDDHNQHQRLLAACAARTKILVRGNHDKKSDTWYQDMGWDLVVEELWFDKFGYDIVLSHEPIHFVAKGNYGPWPNLRNVHGHTHGNGHRSVDVAWYYDERYHIEYAIEHTNYEPIQLTERLFERRIDLGGEDTDSN